MVLAEGQNDENRLSGRHCLDLEVRRYDCEEAFWECYISESGVLIN